MSFFFTTRNDGIYRKVTEACKNHFQKKIKKNLILKELKVNNLYRVDLKSVFILICNIIKGNFFNDYKFLKIKYLNCEIGRHSISASYSHLNSHLYPLVKNFYKMYYFFYGLSLLNFINKNKDVIKSSFIDHGVYINGILINFFSIKQIPFYTNSYPKGLYLKYRLRNKLSYQNLIKIQYPKLKSKFQINKNKNFKWPWVFNKKFFKIEKKNLKDINYVIYCHAFTDGLLANGYDGFIRMDDWLKFTINTLLKKKENKILVKIHPNFHKLNNHFRSKYEVKIFNGIMEEFNHCNEVKFIDYPISNIELMKKLNKKTILVTHHGTPVLEGVANGFKMISSKNTHWSSKFKLSNTWQNKYEYKEILNKSYDNLKKGSSSDLSKLFSIIFNNPYGPHGNKYFIKLLNSQKGRKAKIAKVRMHIEEI